MSFAAIPMEPLEGDGPPDNQPGDLASEEDVVVIEPDELEKYHCAILRTLTLNPVSFQCPHVFDESAIFNWLDRSPDGCCPVCRREIDPNELRRITIPPDIREHIRASLINEHSEVDGYDPEADVYEVDRGVHIKDLARGSVYMFLRPEPICGLVVALLIMPYNDFIFCPRALTVEYNQHIKNLHDCETGTFPEDNFGAFQASDALSEWRYVTPTLANVTCLMLMAPLNNANQYIVNPLRKNKVRIARTVVFTLSRALYFYLNFRLFTEVQNTMSNKAQYLANEFCREPESIVKQEQEPWGLDAPLTALVIMTADTSFYLGRTYARPVAKKLWGAICTGASWFASNTCGRCRRRDELDMDDGAEPLVPPQRGSNAL